MSCTACAAMSGSSAVGVVEMTGQSIVPGLLSTENFDFPATSAVERPALCATSNSVGNLGYTGSTSFRSSFHSILCLRGMTPVSIETCDGSVIEWGVVRAQKVNVDCGSSA